MDTAEPEDQLISHYPGDLGNLPPLLAYLWSGVRAVASAYHRHTGVAVERIELRIVAEDGTIKDLNFPKPEAR